MSLNVCQKSLIPIPYEAINPLAPSLAEILDPLLESHEGIRTSSSIQYLGGGGGFGVNFVRRIRADGTWAPRRKR